MGESSYCKKEVERLSTRRRELDQQKMVSWLAIYTGGCLSVANIMEADGEPFHATYASILFIILLGGVIGLLSARKEMDENIRRSFEYENRIREIDRKSGLIE